MGNNRFLISLSPRQRFALFSFVKDCSIGREIVSDVIPDMAIVTFFKFIITITVFFSLMAMYCRYYQSSIVKHWITSFSFS